MDRLFCSGSLGKFGIMSSNFDCVVFLNNIEPHFVEVLADFKNVVASTFKLKDEEIRMKKYSVQFKIPEFEKENTRNEGAGFEVNLFPAINYRPPNTPTKRLAGIQIEEALKQIVENPGRKDVLMSSLAESQAEFMQQQNKFVQDLVRLAKFWFKSLYFGGEYILGGDTMIELVCVAAADFKKRSLFDAFSMFILYMSRLSHLKIAFYLDQCGERWKVFSSSSVSPAPFHISTQFRELNLTRRERFILEPANCYNDFLDDDHFSATVRGKIESYAKETMIRFKSPRVVVDREESFISLCSYFRPMPMRLIASDSTLHLNSSCAEYLVGGITSTPNLTPLMNIRKLEGIGPQKRKAIESLLDGHMQFIWTTANAAALSGKRQGLNEVVESVCNMIDQDIRGGGTSYYKREWPTSSIKNHEDYDVTFTVPITTAKLGSIVVSVHWDLSGRAGGCFKQ